MADINVTIDSPEEISVAVVTEEIAVTVEGGITSQQSTDIITNNAKVSSQWTTNGLTIEYDTGDVLSKSINSVLYANRHDGVDIGAKINDAYADLPSTGGTIIVEAGNFDFSTPIVIDTAEKHVLIKGQPGGATTLTFTPTTGTAITYNVSNAIATGHGLRDIKLVGAGSQSGDPIGISLGTFGVNDSKGAAGITLRDVHVRGFDIGITNGSNVFLVTFDNCVINFCRRLYHDNGAAGAGASATFNTGENMRFINCTFADSDNDLGGSVAVRGFYLQTSGAVDWNFIGCSFDNCQLFSDIFGGISNTIQITNCHFENPGADSIVKYSFIDMRSDGDSQNLMIDNSSFVQDANSSKPDEFINGAINIVLNGVTASKSSSAATVTRFVTLQNTGDILTWNGFINENSSVTNITETITPTVSGIADGDGSYSSIESTGMSTEAITAEGSAGPIFTKGLTIQGGKSIKFTDGNILTGGGNGLNIATEIGQKVGFHGISPVVQNAHIPDATDAATAITQLNTVILALEEKGFLASS